VRSSRRRVDHRGVSIAWLHRSPAWVFAAPVRLRPSSRRIGFWLAALMVVLGAGALGFSGCERMRAAAPLGSSDAQGRVVRGYGWSLRPAGFTVRYSDGTALSRLWW
jgi:hypothetical protein